MYIPYRRLGLAIAIACFTAVGCSKEPSPTTSQTPAAKPATVAAPAAATVTPDAAVKAIYQQMRNNNVAGVIDAVLPPSEVSKFKAEWSTMLNKNSISDAEKKEFVEQMAKLTAPDAESKLFAEIEPKLKEAEAQMAQLPAMIMMIQGGIQSTLAQNKDLTEQQKKAATDIIGAMAKWAGTVKFTDPSLVKQAISVTCKTARDVKIATLDEMRSLSYDQAMQKASILMGGLKKLTEIYGLSFDKMMDSAKVELVSSQGDTARVKVTTTLLDTPIVSESDMVKVDGKWFGKELVEMLKKQDQQKIAPASESDQQTSPSEKRSAPSKS